MLVDEIISQLNTAYHQEVENSHVAFLLENVF